MGDVTAGCDFRGDVMAGPWALRNFAFLLKVKRFLVAFKCGLRCNSR